ncbi:acyltransferase family protein [Plantactinospora sp. B6F1]|uniref:acyltransferase family protein n=1 Tax=Plantactinospora sp. B6F1 TaxID=3158971 RepID=UPI0032D968E5
MVTQSRPRSRTDGLGRADSRADLTGLRAIAIGSLLLGAAGTSLVPGGFVGVDVFLVISGFLVTGALLRTWRRTGRIDLTGFFARRVRRALPAGALVVAASLPLAVAFLPPDRWSATGWDVLAGAGQVLNWRLAAQDAQAVVPDADASLLAPLWAVGVGAQFMLVWPLLAAGIAAWTVRRWSRRGTGRLALTGPLLGTIGLLAVGSFGWSVWHTAAEPGGAFLVTTTRFWEPALGAGLALLGTRLAGLPRRLGTLLGWAGLAAIALAVLTLRPGPAFPGPLALLPALGAAAIIASGAITRPTDATGTATGPGGVYRALGARPLRALGSVSYPLHLWHWPLLVAAHARFGDLPPTAYLGVLGGAVILAVLTHRYVEMPARTGALDGWSPGQVLRVGALLPAAGVLAGLLFQLSVWPPEQPTPRPAAAPVSSLVSPTSPPAPGAAALGRSPRTSRAGVPVDRVRSIIPKPADAPNDLPDVYRHRCFPPAASGEVRSCVYGDRDAEFTVALAGDRHAASWVPALQAVAVEKRWRLVTYLNPGCPFLRLAVLTGRIRDACAEWYRDVHAALTGPERPRLLLTTGARYQPMAGDRALTGRSAQDALVDGMRRTWSDLVSAGVPTVVLRDTPILAADSPKCVAANPDRLTRCTTDRRVALAASAGAAQLAALKDLDQVDRIDLTTAICPARRCAPVIGGVLVYRDNQHLTATYAATLAPRLRSALDRILAPAAP